MTAKPDAGAVPDALRGLLPRVLTVSVPVAVVGAWVSAPSTMLLSLLVGLATALLVAIEAEDVLDGQLSRRVAVLAGLGAALSVPFVVGVAWLGAVGVLLTGVLALVVVVSWSRARRR